MYKFFYPCVQNNVYNIPSICNYLIYSTAECSWLRLAAGCAMLKICEQKGVGDVYTVEQFYNLSQLAVDDVKQVREIFVTKLHKVHQVNY